MLLDSLRQSGLEIYDAVTPDALLAGLVILEHLLPVATHIYLQNFQSIKNQLCL